MKLKYDSRQLKFNETFGQVTQFDDEYIVKETITDAIQPPGNQECTAYTCCDIAEDKDGVTYDIDDLFNRIPHSRFGASAQDALNETVKNGLLIKGGTLPRVKDFSSYWSAHTGDLSPFDNVRSAISKTGYPIAMFSNWYSNWGQSDVMPIGQNVVSGHMYVIEGWKKINGVTMFQIEAWLGRKLYMPEDTFNDAISPMGAGTAVLSTYEIDAIRNKTIREHILDGIKNAMLILVSIYQQLIKQKQLSPVTKPIDNAIIKPMDNILLWDKDNARHSIRVMCDNAGLSLNDKNIITACIHVESNFDNTAKCENKDKNDKVWSTDWGICQINDYWHVIKFHDFPSVQYIIDNPEKAVAYMIQCYKDGRINQWVSYSSGAYKNFL